MSTASSVSDVQTRNTTQQGKLSGRRILVVEDEFFIALDIQQVVEEEGAEVTTAMSLDDGFTALSASRDGFDAAILDIRLGDTDVFPLARVLIERGVPVIFHSAHLGHLNIARDFPTAMALDKPAPSESIVGALSQLIG
ncbi:response regulator [Parvularcula lutaonensis]|uniref:Response regulator n=1 Tax=Parvularcula lutaonensis TaxID=491923 RepID=A0ABV7MGS4_9PROT|nr:response regulator [Parvularcula lutaonensis]GGY55575.1 hypothetical protein GCM10007148_26840 [Parvularcula lutaonensis]